MALMLSCALGLVSSRRRRRGSRLPAVIALLLLPSFSAATERVRYYHLDAVGNVRALTDQAGQVVERHDYLPFGEECLTPTCTPLQGDNTRKFTGKERDAETGLDYYRARYYDPKIGRFISEDPIKHNGGLNFYAYVDNSPVNFIDPTGEMKLPGWMGTTARKWVLAGMMAISGKKSKEAEALMKALNDTKVVHMTKGGKIKKAAGGALCLFLPPLPGAEEFSEDLIDELFPDEPVRADPVVSPVPVV